MYTVLIVDDDPRARGLAQEAVKLGLPGFAVRTAVHEGRERHQEGSAYAARWAGL